MKTHARKDYITEEDFNRIVIHRDTVRPVEPEDDSKGDSAVDEEIEAELGEHFAEESFESLDDVEDDDRAHIHTQDEQDKEKIEDQISTQLHEGSSTWPDASEISN